MKLAETTTARSELDYTQLELKLDGGSRFTALAHDRLLMILATGDIYIVHIRFDQADLDVADATFVKIQTPDKLVPS